MVDKRQPQLTPIQLIDFAQNRIVGTLLVSGPLPETILLDGIAVYLRGERDQSVYALASSLTFYSTDFTNA